MASIKDYNRKLKSLVNTRKITKTMKMVAASKLRKAYEAQTHAKYYAENITSLISRICASVELSIHPLLVPHQAIRKAHILLFTSDRGLCGSFNHNAIGGTAAWMKEQQGRFQAISLSFCGRRGFSFFQKKAQVKAHYQNVTAKPQYADAKKIGDELSQSYLGGEFDEIYLAYNHFINPLSQSMVIEKILPIEPQAVIQEKEFVEKANYIFEPEAAGLLSSLIPHYLYFKIYFALLENSAGEHGARMSAMDNATKNATDLINRYKLLRNRLRQSEITTELTEIVSGAEALKHSSN